MVSTYKDLLNQIKCGKAQSVVFTEDDLKQVKACLPTPISPVGIDYGITIPTKTSCINDGIDKINEIVTAEIAKQSVLIELCTVKAKVEESLDHYSFILNHYEERYKFFNDTISAVEPFTSQYLYWDDEINRLAGLEKSAASVYLNATTKDAISVRSFLILSALSDSDFSKILPDFSNVNSVVRPATLINISSILTDLDIVSYYTYRSARIQAQANSLVSKNGATNALSQRLQGIESLPKLTPAVQSMYSSAVSPFSEMLNSYFSGLSEAVIDGDLVIPSRTSAFSIRITNLDKTKIRVQQTNQNGKFESKEVEINIRNNQYLLSDCFRRTVATKVMNRSTTSTNAYDSISGKLYNGIDQSYQGLYRKLKNPIQYLYTLEERGLTFDPNKIDPVLASVNDAPVSVKIDDITFYISNQDKYEEFFDNLQTTLPGRITNERTNVFPSQINGQINEIKGLARMEVADQFRRIEGMPLKLARPTSYKSGNSSIFSQGEFNYSQVDAVLSSKLQYYTAARNELLSIIDSCKKNIDHLNTLIAQNTMSAELLESKISSIDCFVDSFKQQATSADCEAKVNVKLGSDPLFIRTLSGSDSTMPDATSLCYWKAFAKALNKVSIFPVPDTNSPLLRYYPVNNLIPTPAGIALITLPQRWKPLFVLSTPLGILVTFLTMPVAIVGIPLPSIYALFLAPDGNKYMLFAPNVTVLYGSPYGIQYGFKPDMSSASDTPTGLTGPFSGNPIKGSLNIPLKSLAASSKAARLAAVTAALALGETPQIKTRNGTPIGQISVLELLNNYQSLAERASTGADADFSASFDKQISKFKRNINRQLDRLGQAQISAITGLKDRTRNQRQSSVDTASNEPDSAKRREAKKAARKIDPLTLQSKISGVLSDFDDYIDKIKLGTIKFPDDPTVYNPKLPSAITGIFPLIEQASNGGLTHDFSSTSLTKKLKRIAASIDTDKIGVEKKRFNLTKSGDLLEFKDALRKYLTAAISRLQGDSSDNDEVDPNLPPAEIEAIRRSNELRKKRLKKALAFTTLAVVPPKLTLFNSTAPCCPTEEETVDLSIPPQVQAAVSVLITLFDAYVNGLTLDVLRKALGESISNLGLNALSIVFDSILNSLPDIALPSKPDLVSIIQAIFVPIVTSMTIPQSVNPLGILFPVPIVIPLDAIIKPLLKVSVAYLLELILRMLSDDNGILQSSQGTGSPSYEQIIKQLPCGKSEYATVMTSAASNSVSVTLPNGFNLSLPKIPVIPLDLIGYFALLTSTDLVDLIRNLIMAALDGILDPLRKVIDPILAIAQSLKGLSFTVLDSANPYVLPIKLAMMAIQLQIPNSVSLKLSNLDAIDAIRAAYFPVVEATEPVLKEVAYLASILSCALAGSAGVRIARLAANPFLNQDDLPPWERLTHKNPLFAIFLDEIAWRSSLTSTGTLLFQTKTPGLYPTAWSPTIFTDPGALYHAS